MAPFDPNAAGGAYGGGGVYGGGGMDPYGQPQAMPGYDPFMASPYAGAGGDPFAGPQGYGVVGPQPVRFGWTTHYDFAYISNADLQDDPANPGGPGDVTVYEYNIRFDNVVQSPTGWIWKHSPELNFTQIDFNNIEETRLPVATQNGLARISDNYYRIGYRFETTSPQYGPVSYRFGFTPAVATDFQRQLNSQAWNFDADATAYFRTSPNLMWVAGVLYWDRAEDHILPNAGVVWNPNEFWEIRATFPKSRAEVFIGTPMGVATWLYAGAEYDIQSWQAGEIDGTDPQLQIEEWRAFAGLRWEACTWESYLDFGYAFDRKWSVHGLSSVAPLHPDDAFMIRAGIEF
ncbi:hypothetical protein [Rubinisphaera margarita]|uniref:hypothetical protein n=1 Tax=Rubinisphaera margarita TaxID=2909586 RepID=UPI001EE7AD23|nr:hypothetical protein [Rubinisphaera margarita]MCG6155467.1 hypothetical protein [Rubinisphaera margarita]